MDCCDRNVQAFWSFSREHCVHMFRLGLATSTLGGMLDLVRIMFVALSLGFLDPCRDFGQEGFGGLGPS